MPLDRQTTGPSMISPCSMSASKSGSDAITNCPSTQLHGGTICFPPCSSNFRTENGKLWLDLRYQLTVAFRFAHGLFLFTQFLVLVFVFVGFNHPGDFGVVDF